MTKQLHIWNLFEKSDSFAWAKRNGSLQLGVIPICSEAKFLSSGNGNAK